MSDSQKQLIKQNDESRRRFIKRAALLAGSAAVISLPHAAAQPGMLPEPAFTVRQIIDRFIEESGGARPGTVDTLKSGNPDSVVRGIVTTMFATIPVIRRAAGLGANFVIAHEPTFYNHQDETAWLEHDDVYRYKAGLLKEKQVTVWRCHDYIHAHRPDGVLTDLLADLGWSSYADKDHPELLLIPAVPLRELMGHLKSRLGISTLRFIGDPSAVCRRVLVMPGQAGGTRQIEAISGLKPDVVICGEVQEWETPEYVRDARASGQQLSLVVSGHIPSEESGSRFMLDWLRKNFPGIPARHIPSGNSLNFY